MTLRALRLGGTILAAAAAAVLWSATASASVTGHPVDNTNPSCNDTTGSPAYCTIQAAVNAASPNDEIDVHAGIYPENVVVGKPLTLRGAQPGVSVSTRTCGGPAESTIVGQLTLQAAVTFHAFSLANPNVPGSAVGVLVKTAGSGSAIRSDMICNVSSTVTTSDGAAQAIYLENGPDNVLIDANSITNVASDRSAKGVFVGDSTASNASTGITISNNTINVVTSFSRGAYGITTNNATGAELTISGNTLSNLVGGGWVHAIAIEGPAAVAAISGNSISSIDDTGPAPDDAIAVYFESDPAFASAHVNQNNLNVASAQFGIALNPALTGSTLDGECNWWNSASGPSGAGPGTGAMVGPNIDFTPWLTAANPSGACNGGIAPPSFVAGGSFAAYGTSDSQAVTVANVPNRILVFEFSGKLGSDTLGSVTYAGMPLTLLSSRSQGTVRLEIRYLLNPPAGTAPLAWSKTGASQNIVWGYSVYQGVNQTTPWGGASNIGASGDTAGPKSVSANAQSGDLVVDAAVFNGPNGVGTGPTSGAGQTQRWSRRLSTTQGSSSDKPAGSPVTMTETPSAGTGNGIDWALIAAPLKPVSGGGGPLASTTSTQSSTTAANVPPGTSVTDTATVTGAGPTPTGTVTFFLCQPATVTGNGGNCASGGTQVGAAKPLDGTGHATSDATTSTTTPGTYCWRAAYSGDPNYNPSSDGGPTNECFTVAVPSGGGPIAFESASSFSTYGTSDSQAVTVPSTANRILVFEFSGKLGSDTLSSVTYGGVPLTLLSARGQGTVRLEIRYLVNPPAGTAQLAWTKTGAAQNITWGYSIYSSVNQATPFGAVVQAGASGDASSSKSVVVAASSGDVVLDAVVFNGPNVPSAGPTAGAGQSTRWSRRLSTTQGGSSDEAASGTTTMTWTPAAGTGTGIDWALIGVPLKQA